MPITLTLSCHGTRHVYSHQVPPRVLATGERMYDFYQIWKKSVFCFVFSEVSVFFTF